MTIYPSRERHRAVVIAVMAAALMVSLDTTIANVALPHIQGSVAASGDEISWVLTSYIVAAAIFTRLCGWLADKIGRKTLMIISIIGFTPRRCCAASLPISTKSSSSGSCRVRSERVATDEPGNAARHDRPRRTRRKR